MNVTFYLRDLTKERGNLTAGKEQPIYCYITFNDERLRLSTQLKVFPKDWNESKELVRGVSTNVGKMNARLKSIRSKAEDVEKDYLGKILTPEMLKKELLPIIFPEKVAKTKKKVNLYDFLDDYILSNPKGSENGTIKSYKQLLPLLKEFSKKYGKSVLNFESIDEAWRDLFVKFLRSDKGHSINNADKHVKNVKALMKDSFKKDHHTNVKYESFKREKEETKEIYLTEEEIKAIHELQVSEDYQVSKDIFVFSCLTGLRISDVMKLKKQNWAGDFIILQIQKTKDKLEIPLRKTAKSILSKYKGEFPSIYEQKYNRQLKDICEQVEPLKEEILAFVLDNGKREEKSVYKYELVKSHTARRSFATNEYKRGVDPLFIRAITGHKTEKDFFNYIKMGQREKASSMLEIFKDRDF